MELHLVSGFLGAGKTTNIINCCKYLMQRGKNVAVITNDQGKYLVDTAFILSENIPAVDVQSGCFCSNYPDMLKQLEDLKQKVDPDIVFAEAIGSAANLVGTVIQPLSTNADFFANSLSAIVDARFILMLTQHQYLPFSDSVSATFLAQIRESNYLVINKIDLLNKEDLQILKSHLTHVYSDKIILYQSADVQEDVIHWYHQISKQNVKIIADQSFDPKLHSKALDRLKWEEDIIDFSDNKNVFPKIIEHIDALLIDLKKHHSQLAHIKAFVEYGNKHMKFSITALDQESWKYELQKLCAKKAKMILNMRVQK